MEKTPEKIVVAKAEDWPAAADVHARCIVRAPQGEYEFPIRAIACVDWDEMQQKYGWTESKESNKWTAAYKEWERNETAKAETQFALVLANGCALFAQGSLQEQIRRLAEFPRRGDLWALRGAIEQLSGFNSGFKMVGTPVHMAVANIDDWKKATEAPVSFGFNHMDGTTYLFTVKGIPQDRMKAIEFACAPPPPPLKDVTARNQPFAQTVMEPDPENPEYKASVESLTRAEFAMKLQEGLGFTFPGADDAAKTAWLMQRPFGEVYALNDFLRGTVMGYHAHADFYLPNSALEK